MFSEDPAGYVAANIKKGDYKYWAFRESVNSAPMGWIPGITQKKSHLARSRFDYVDIGIEINHLTNGEAEIFFRKYNKLMERERQLAISSGEKRLGSVKAPG